MSGQLVEPPKRPLAAQVFKALSDDEYHHLKSKTVVRSVQDSGTGQSVLKTVAQYPLLRGVPQGIQGYIHLTAPGRLQQPGWVIFEPLREDRYGGLVQAFPGAPNWGMVQLPAANLVIGHEKRDKLTIRGLENPFPKPRLVGETVAPLENLISTLITTLLEQPAVKEFAGISLQQYAEKHSQELVNAIMTGFRFMFPKTNPFASRLPTMSEIWKNATPYRKDKAKWRAEAELGTVVIYVILYRWLDDNGKENFKDYWGKTTDVPTRNKRHRECIETSANTRGSWNHYGGSGGARDIMTRPGGSWDLFPIIAIRKPNTANADDVMKSVHPWVEQLMIALARSYNRKLLSMPNTISAVTQLWSVELAEVILQTVDTICKQSQFRTFERQDPRGLNWGSPIMASSVVDPALWVGTEIADRYVFKKRSVKVQKNESSFKTKGRTKAGETEGITEYIYAVLGQQYRGRQVFLTIPKHWGIEKGDKVVPVIEIMKLEQAIHPHAWAAMPTIGPFDKWRHGNRVAVRIEWFKGDNIRTAFVHPGQVFRFYSKKDLSDANFDGDYSVTRHMPIVWSLAMQMISTFLGWEWDYQGPQNQVLRTKRIEPWPARVKTAKFDFRNQVVEVAPQKKIKVAAPRLLTMDQTAQMLLDEYGRDLVIGLPHENLFKGDWMTNPGRQRPANCCDFCDFLGLDFSRSNKDSNYVRKFRPGASADLKCVTKEVGKLPGGETLHSCQKCELLCRYCTFSSRHKLWGDLEKYRTLSLYARPDNPVVEVPRVGQGLEELVFDGAVDDLSDDEDDEVDTNISQADLA